MMRLFHTLSRPFAWARKVWALLREIKTHEQHTLMVQRLLVRELRRNAEIAGMYPNSWSIQDVQERLEFGRWDQYGAEWSVLHRRHPELWGEIADAYDELARTRRQGAPPPAAETLTALADRLGEARL